MTAEVQAVHLLLYVVCVSKAFVGLQNVVDFVIPPQIPRIVAQSKKIHAVLPNWLIIKRSINALNRSGNFAAYLNFFFPD